MGLKEQLTIASNEMKGFKIPSLPKELIELQNLFKNARFINTHDVANIIKKNTVLSGELIKVANQKQFKPKGADDDVVSVKDAVEALGLDKIETLIIGLAFKASVSGEVFDDLMEHTVAVANVCAELTVYLTDISAEEAYLAGLFHNSGAFIMAMKFEGYDKVFYNTISNSYSGITREIERFKMHHGVFGLLVAKEWSLPSIYSQVILTHHQQDLTIIRDDKVRTLVYLVQLANSIVAESLFNGYLGDEVTKMKKNAIADLMIKNDDISEIRRALMTDNLV